MGAALPILMIGQTIAKVAATNREAHQMRDMYNDKAKMEENKAATQKLQASQAADKSAREEKKIVDRARLAAAANKAVAGASGLMDEGSLLDVNNASNDEAIYDLKQSLLNQRITTQNYRNEESYSNINADRYRTAGRNVIHQAHAQNAATILGAVASAYGQGMFGSGSSKTDSNWTYDAAVKGNNPWGLSQYGSGIADTTAWGYRGITPRKGYTSYSWG